MGIRVELIGDRFILHQTITGGCTEPLTRNEAVAHIVRGLEKDFKLKVIEAFMTFPHHFADASNKKVTTIHIEADKSEAFHKWHIETLRQIQDDKEYFKKVDQKYEECITELKGKVQT